MDKERSIRGRVAERLAAEHESRHVLLGFDGFVDEICRVVRHHDVNDGPRMFDTIGSFAEHLAGSAGLSAAVELYPVQTRPGGNAPNMGAAVRAFGNKLSLIAALGRDGIHPVFSELAASCGTVISLGDPGRTLALEFSDGKIMLNRPMSFEGDLWDTLMMRLPAAELDRLVEHVSLVGLLDWSIDPALGRVFTGFYDIISRLERRPVVFFDLSDLRRTTGSEIIGVCVIIRNFGAVTTTLLGLNESESRCLANALSLDDTGLPARAAAIRNELGITAVVVHSLKNACVASHGGTWLVEGPYTTYPVVSTGGGDCFNAGFCNAWMMEMEPVECACTAAYTAGYFVSRGKPPDHRELTDFIKDSS